jgi:hypothetical protein
MKIRSAAQPQVSPMPRRFPTQARNEQRRGSAKVRHRSPARKSTIVHLLLQLIAQRCSGVSRETM